MKEMIKKVALGLINTTSLKVHNHEQTILKLVTRAKTQGYEALFLPELVLSGAGCMDMFSYLPFLESIKRSLKNIIEHTENFTLGLGLPLQDKEGEVYNCYVVIKNRAILNISTIYNEDLGIYFNYDSEAIFSLFENNYRQKETFTLFDNTFHIYACADDARTYSKPDEVLLFPYARRFEDGSLLSYDELMDSLSMTNTIFCVNLCGNDSGSDIYDGLCYIADEGKMLTRSEALTFKREDLIGASDGITPFLEEIDTLVRAAALGLFDYMLKTFSKGFALSMSGGADSALCAYLVAYGQASALINLGKTAYLDLLKEHGIFFDKNFSDDVLQTLHDVILPKLLTTVYQGSDSSGEITYNAAKGVSEDLGASHHSWSISPLVKNYESLVNNTKSGHILNWEEHDLTLQNIQARVRAPGIWMMANYQEKLLITTCNGSEDAVGYCTMDGDTAGCVAPIGDICKSKVLMINKKIAEKGIALNEEFSLPCKAMILVVNQAPTAELRPGGTQRDEKDLMPYPILDRIHVLQQEEGLSPQSITDILKEEFKNFDKVTLEGFVKKYFDKFFKAQWKRERGATTFHLEKSDLNGMRIPVLSGGASAFIDL